MLLIAFLMVCEILFDSFAVDAGDTPPDYLLVVKTLSSVVGDVLLPIVATKTQSATHKHF